jgi:glycosyltransferase involved in cell wall biosynthesis
MNDRCAVAMVIHDYYPRVGGAQQQVADLARLLRQDGVEVCVLTRRFLGLQAFEVRDGIPVYRLPIPGPPALAALVFTVSGVRLLSRLRPAVVHAHELFSATTTAVTAKRLLGNRVVATAHRSGTLGDVYRVRHKAFGEQRLRTIVRQVDAFVVISREIDQELAELGVPDSARVHIPNGVDTGRFRPLAASEKQSLRARLGLSAGPLAVFTGRLVIEKRLDLLIGIWPAVRAAQPEAALVLVGAGPEEKALRAAAGPGVVFAGRQDDVAPYLQAADVFVLPSAAEGLSVALLEAMAAGLAPIVTAVGGAADVIEHGHNGWLIPPNDPDALSAALIQWLSDPVGRAAMAQHARERVLAEFALPVMAARLRDLYARLAGHLDWQTGD